jgi:HEAT repeat protein
MGLYVHALNEHDIGQDAQRISAFIEDLGNPDGLVRHRARRALIDTDGLAVPGLIRALDSRERIVRWEAAKTLGEIVDPAAAPALVRTLEDEGFAIRWLAAEALIAMGSAAVPPLMYALAHHSDSIWLRSGAHHVLRAQHRHGLPQSVDRVLQALEDIEPAIEVPVLALSAWKEVTHTDYAPEIA